MTIKIFRKNSKDIDQINDYIEYPINIESYLLGKEREYYNSLNVRSTQENNTSVESSVSSYLVWKFGISVKNESHVRAKIRVVIYKHDKYGYQESFHVIEGYIGKYSKARFWCPHNFSNKCKGLRDFKVNNVEIEIDSKSQNFEIDNSLFDLFDLGSILRRRKIYLMIFILVAFNCLLFGGYLPFFELS